MAFFHSTTEGRVDEYKEKESRNKKINGKHKQMFCLDWKEIMKKKNFLHFKYILFLFLLFIDFAFFIFSFYELEVMCELGKKFSPSHSTPLGMKIRQFSMYIYCSTIFRKFPRDEKKKKTNKFCWFSTKKDICFWITSKNVSTYSPPIRI